MDWPDYALLGAGILVAGGLSFAIALCKASNRADTLAESAFRDYYRQRESRSRNHLTSRIEIDPETNSARGQKRPYQDPETYKTR